MDCADKSLQDFGRLLKIKKRDSDSQHTTTSPAPTRADFGVDFGTRFTKVVLQLPHLEKRQQLALGSARDGLHPARIAIYDDIAYPPDITPPPDASWVDYLKMRLFQHGEVAFGDGTPRPLAEIAALAALYLAGVFRLAQSAAQATGHLRQDNVQWFGQLGVAVQTYDSPDLKLFEEVADIAWAWKDRPPSPIAINILLDEYAATKRSRPPREERKVAVAPELVAAISHIASRPDAPEGLYAFLDIGGGTLDGTVFSLRRGPQATVFILSAEVAPLGTIAAAQKISTSRKSINAAETRLITGKLTPTDEIKLNEFRLEVHSFLRKIFIEASKKSPLDNFQTLQTDLDRALNTGDYKTIPILLSGGGATSVWYKTAIETLNMRQQLIGRLPTRVVPKPNGWAEEQYPRFVVANGLSNRNLQLRHEYRLPTDLPYAPELPEWRPPFKSPVSQDFV